MNITLKAGDPMAVDVNGRAVKWHPPYAAPCMFAARESECGQSGVLVTAPWAEVDGGTVAPWLAEFQRG